MHPFSNILPLMGHGIRGEFQEPEFDLSGQIVINGNEI